MRHGTFKIGGIHPPENKLSANIPIVTLPPPAQAILHLAQNLGASPVPVVKPGDKVRVGTLVARGEAFISAHLHSSVSGTVARIDNVLDSSGYKRKAIVIQVEGDEWEADIDRSPDLVAAIDLNPGEIVAKIKEMGIVGLGGAAFPSHIKYIFPAGKKADTLVINGVECEPYLTADHRLMMERPDDILMGIRIMMIAGQVDRAVLGIEANKPDAIAMMTGKARAVPGLEVKPLEVRYPQGAEKQLIKALLNREVPAGKLPPDVGCIINNVGTALAIYEAVLKNKPLVDRVVTISGKGLLKTGNFKVRIGTPAQALLAALGEELPAGTGKIICGGPLMGKAVNSLDVPITKGTSGFVLVADREAYRPAVCNCIRCARCVGVCPMGLEPYLLERLAVRQNFTACEAAGITECMECGCCSFACPAARPLLDYIRLGKAQVMRSIRERR